MIEAVLNGLDELEHPFHEIRVYSPRPIDAGVRLPPVATNVVLPSRLPLGLWEQVTLLQAHGSRDILFCPSYTLPLFARCPTLLTHHGSYEGYKDAVQVFSIWMRLKARRDRVYEGKKILHAGTTARKAALWKLEPVVPHRGEL